MSRSLLVHTITHYSLTGSNNWGVDEFSEGVTVKYVRVESVKKNILNSLGDAQDDKATLFVDIKNSSPERDYQKKDKITFNGIDYRVREVSLQYGDNDKLHHLEIKLV